MTRPATSSIGALLTLAPLFVPTIAAAQYRPADRVPDLTSGTLSSLVGSQRSAIESCASRADTDAFVAEVSARVSAGPPPSTMYNARISVTVRSRPRDGEFEGCVRRRVRDALRHQGYAVSRSVSARHTFRIADRPEAPPPRPTPSFQESDVRRLLNARTGRLQQCLEIAGVPGRVTLHVAVEPSGQLSLTSADLPPGAPPRALGCLAGVISGIQTPGRPARRVTLTHSLTIRG